jgi:PAS domain S-box-containing protein
MTRTVKEAHEADELNRHLEKLRQEIRSAKEEISAKEAYINIVEETSNGLRRAYKEIQAVHELSRKLGRIHDAERTPDLLFDGVGQILNYAAAAYLSYDSLNSTFYLVRERALSDAMRAEIRAHKGFGYMTWVFREGRPVVLPDVIREGDNLLSIMLVPLATTPGQGAEPIGMLQFFVNLRPEDFTQRDFDLLMILANQATLAMENGNMYKAIELRAQALNQMKNHLTCILESMTNAVMSIEADGRVALCNAVMEKMLGISSYELVGSRLEDVLDAELALRLNKLFQETLAGVPPHETELSIPRENGSPLVVGATASMLKGEDKDMRGVLISLRDLTETKELIHLRKLDQLKDGFISTVSHEIRTPITAIKSFSEILMNYNEKDEETKREFVSIINRESDRLTRLVDNILDLSKMESGKMQWHLKPLSLTEILREAKEATQSLFIDKKQQLLFEFTSSAPLPNEPMNAERGQFPEVYADKDKLLQVAINLLSNANKFTPDGGAIRVNIDKILYGRGRLVKEFLRVGIHDNGPGIAPDHLESVFEKFGQITTDVLTAKPPGTGLGLPISREIIRHLGGEIWAESNGTSGSTFYFTVPVFHELENYTDADLEQHNVKIVDQEHSPSVSPARRASTQ